MAEELKKATITKKTTSTKAASSTKNTEVKPKKEATSKKTVVKEVKEEKNKVEKDVKVKVEPKKENLKSKTIKPKKVVKKTSQKENDVKVKRPNGRKTLVGTVISIKNNKTITVLVETYTKHPLYLKRFKKSKKFAVHDEANIAKIGDVVKIQETRPLSKTKHFRLVEIKSHAIGGQDNA